MEKAKHSPTHWKHVREGKSMIDSVKPEQKARFSEFKEKWCRIGLSTAPADRLKAEKGISMIYETLGLKPPQVVWCTSPLANGLTRALAQRLSAAKGRKSEVKVWEHARSSIGITLDTYSHVMPGLQEAAALRFEEGIQRTAQQSVERMLANG